ncbi:MAG: transcriptional repressor [Nitrospirae bacterium]|nr:transcriptional repressor [Nitrospirota bacterium]MBF0533590.1 transcriptional repressor [Nitrospirota bacterium]MBF0617993.1 transcriptional repressor [Nitrospirota bacterium]
MINEAKLEFEQYLNSRQLKMTTQRELILEVFLTNAKHISSEELYNIVSAKDSSVGQATVYRTLKLLTDSAIARECEFGDGIHRYEPNIGVGHHDHLVCLQCGKKIEIYDEKIEKQQELIAKKHGFKITKHRMDLFGVCSDCLFHNNVSQLHKGYKDASNAMKSAVAETMPLARLEIGSKAVVTEFILEDSIHSDTAAPENKSITAHHNRVQELGIRAGKVVEMLNNKGRGPVLFKVDDSRIALARGLAMKIMVKRDGQI